MASKVNLIIDQGATYSGTITSHDAAGQPIDFSTYAVNSQVRKTFQSGRSFPFSCNGSSNGVITLSMTANQTGNMWPGRYVYDVEVTDLSGIVSRVAEGLVIVTPQVTK